MSKKADVAKKHLLHDYRIDDSLHEEITKTYLRTSAKIAKKKINPIPKVFWVGVFFTVFLILFILIYNDTINIRVRVSAGAPFVDRNAETGPTAEKKIFLIKGGESAHRLIDKDFFFGDGRASSRKTKEELVLCNSRGHGWADYRIEFKKPVDLADFDINYTAKGRLGDESIVLLIVDADNRSYRIEEDASSRLTKDWQTFTINFKPIKKHIDLENVSMMRFEFGSLTTGNSPAATIFLKDIYAARTKRIKWL